VKRNVMGRAVPVIGIVVVATAGTALPAHAQAQAQVLRPQCGWGLGESESEIIPGTGITDPVDASFCQVVLTGQGVNFVIRGQAPDGYTADRAVVDGGRGGVTVVTPSGAINGTGHFR
jgi:hypothetical protein